MDPSNDGQWRANDLIDVGLVLRPMAYGRVSLYLAIAALSTVVDDSAGWWVPVLLVFGAFIGPLTLGRLSRTVALSLMVGTDIVVSAVAWFGPVGRPFVVAVFIFLALITSTMLMTALSLRVSMGAIGAIGVLMLVDIAGGNHPLVAFGVPDRPSTVQFIVISIAAVSGFGGLVAGTMAIRRVLRTVLVQSAQSVRRFRSLFENSPVGVLVVVAEEIQLANPAAHTLMGSAEGELVGESVIDLFSPSDPDRARRSLMLVASGQASRTIRNVSFADGERQEVRVDLTLSPVDVDGRSGIQIIIVDQTMRHVAEEAVRASQHRFKVAFLGSATPAVLVNLDGSIAEANAAFIDMIDSDSESIRNARWDDGIGEKPRDELFAWGKAAISDPTAEFRSELQVRTVKGEPLLTLFNAAVLPGVDGNAEYFIAQFHDITELRAAQEARRMSDERYKNLFEQLPVALCRVQVDGTILAVNDALRKMMGSLRDADQSPPVGSFYANQEEVIRFFKIMEAETVVRDFETELVRLDGTKLLVRMDATQVREGDKMVFDAAIVDISEQRAAREELSLRARYSAAVADLGGLALRETETKSLFRSAVRMLAELFDGCSVLILDLSDGVWVVRAGHGDGRARSLPANLLSEVRRLAEETIVTSSPAFGIHDELGSPDSTGSTVVVRMVGNSGAFGALAVVGPNDRMYRNEDVRFLESVAAVLALAEERRISRIEQQRVIESKDELIASVSHELRTPLTVVAGMASELEDHWDMFSADEAHEMVTLMSAQASDMRDLIEDLLVVARADIGKVTVVEEEVDLLTQLDHVLVGMSSELRDRITVESGSCLVLADEGRVRQILRNLISNAIKYGGDRISVSVRVEGDAAILAVTDDGPGIPPHERDHIFTPYGRAHDVPSQPNSIGLGLTVSRTLARLMGGELVYTYNGASMFECELPLAPTRS